MTTTDTKARDAAIDECIAALHEIMKIYYSNKYSYGAPLTTFSERFATERCIEALTALKSTQGEK